MKYHEGEKVTLYHGDNREVMRTLPDASVDAIVCDPPYELGFMGKKWDASGIAYSVEMWQEALRVLKPGGHLLAFSGSRTYHRMTVAIEDAGFEIRDQIMWIYGSGFPKSHNLKGEWAGWGTALKPAHEPIVVARKPLIGTVAENVLTYGTGGLNIDGARVEGREITQSRGAKETSNTYSKISVASLENAYPAELGRWPANVIHDGSDEVVELFPDTKGGVAVRSKSGGKNFGSDTDKPPLDDLGYGDAGSAARFFYCAKASKKDRNEGLEHFSEQSVGFATRYCLECGKNVPQAGSCGCDAGVEMRPPNPQKNHHPTVKPTDLMRYLCRLVTPPNGIILDPFMGSGSTGKAAILEGFRFIGIEMTDEYLPIAKARIEWATTQGDDDLFGGAV